MTRAWLLVLSLTLALGLIWCFITPPWTAPDEPGHYLYTRLLADLGRIPTRADNNAGIESPVIASLAATNWWDYEKRPVPHPLPERLADDAVLAASGAQIQDEPLLFYIPPSLLLRWFDVHATLDPAQALRWLRLWSLSLRLVAVIATLSLVRHTWPDRPDRALGLGLLVGILPMVGFIGGSLNNDALALAWGAVAFALLATASSPWRWFLAAAVILAGPLLADKSLAYLWPLALVWAAIRSQRLRNHRLLVLVGVIAIVALLLVPNPRWASGWERYPALASSRSPENALRLSDHRSDYRVRLAQIIADKSVLAIRGQPLVLEAVFWGEPGSVLNLRLTNSHQTQQRLCIASSSQQSCRLPFVLDARAAHIRILAAIGDLGRPEATGDIHLRLRLLDDNGRDYLFNGDGRYAAPLGSPLFTWLERLAPIPNGFFARALGPAAWDAPAQFRYLLFAGFTWASFWGYFGWLSRPLPWWSYAMLAGFTLLAGWGVLRWGMVAIRRWRRQQTTETDQLLALSLLAFFLILTQVWTPMLGQAWQPQGRYLFSALLPISVILYQGWEFALPTRWRPYLTSSLILGLIGLNILSWIIVT
jgi:hypothetical protein